jgi:hypothetical protein
MSKINIVSEEPICEFELRKEREKESLTSGPIEP